MPAIWAMLTAAPVPAGDTALEKGKSLMNEGRLSEARAVLLEAVKQEPARAEAHYRLGLVYLGEGSHPKAIESAKKAVALSDSVASYHLLLARAYGMEALNSNIFAALGPALSAKQEYETTIALDSRNLDARYELLQYHLTAPPIAGASEQEAVKQAEALERQDPLMGAYGWARIWEK